MFIFAAIKSSIFTWAAHYFIAFSDFDIENLKLFRQFLNTVYFMYPSLNLTKYNLFLTQRIPLEIIRLKSLTNDVFESEYIKITGSDLDQSVISLITEGEALAESELQMVPFLPKDNRTFDKALEVITINSMLPEGLYSEELHRKGISLKLNFGSFEEAVNDHEILEARCNIYRSEHQNRSQ